MSHPPSPTAGYAAKNARSLSSAERNAPNETPDPVVVGVHASVRRVACGGVGEGRCPIVDEIAVLRAENTRLRHENDVLHALLDEVKTQRDTYAALSFQHD